MHVIGVDEAGYGPLMGPLVVAAAGFRVPGVSDPAAAEAAVRAALSDPRVPRIGDSKRVYGAGGLDGLELPLLAFLGLSGARYDALDPVLAALGVDRAARDSGDWYGGELPRYPLRVRPDDLGRACDSLAAVLAAHGVEFGGLHADVLPAARLNRLFDASGNKATVLFDVSTDVALRAAAAHGAAAAPPSATVVFDRQGGRRNYLPPLQERFSESFVWRLHETRTSSAYRFETGGRALHVRYDVKADATAPAVGLASMCAKYLREVFMALWNGWFADLCPGVRPTAGYVTDGRRWLEETREQRKGRGIDDTLLVRRR